MICIFCKSETEVTNSRPALHTPSVWRRRACKRCVAQFTTIEAPDFTKSFKVSDGSSKELRAFDRDVLFLSLHGALAHRPDAIQSATALTATVLSRLLRAHIDKESPIDRRLIAKTTMAVLKRYDPLAAATYKAYHQQTLKQA